jgi:hypothetical protein
MLRASICHGSEPVRLLTSPADVDAEFVTWLTEAYRVGVLEHLRR